MDNGSNEIRRWTAKRKVQVVMDVLKGKTTVVEVSRQHDLPPAEIERWIDEGVANMENGFRSKPRDIRETYERKLDEAHAALGESQLEIKALKKLQRLLDADEIN